MYIWISSVLLFFHGSGSPEAKSRMQGVYRNQILGTEREVEEEEEQGEEEEVGRQRRRRGRWIYLGAMISQGLQVVRKGFQAYIYYRVLCQSKVQRTSLPTRISQECTGPEKNVSLRKELQLLFADHTLGQLELEGGSYRFIPGPPHSPVLGTSQLSFRQ